MLKNWIVTFGVLIGASSYVFAELPEGIRDRIPEGAKYERRLSVIGLKGLYSTKTDGGAVMLGVVNSLVGDNGFLLGADFNVGGHFSPSVDTSAFLYAGPLLGWKFDFWDKRLSLMPTVMGGAVIGFRKSDLLSSYVIEPSLSFQVRVSKVVRLGASAGYLAAPSYKELNGAQFALQLRFGLEAVYWYADL